MEIEVYFNGYRLLDYVDKIRDVRRDLVPPRTLVTQKVHGRAGEYLFGVENGPRITEVDVMVIENSYELLQKRVDELAYILDTDEAVELVLGDEDGKVRYAILDGEIPLKEIGSTGLFTLVFYQPDPHKYGPTRTQVIAAPPADFARSSSAYMEDGTQVSADEPRYEPGKFGQALMVEEGTTNLAPAPDPTIADLSYAVEVTDTTGVASFLQNGIYFGDNSVLRYAYEPYTVQPSTAYTFSCYVRMDDGLAPNVNNAKESQYDFAIVIGGNAYPAIATDVGGGLYRVSGTATTSASPADHNGVVKYTEHSARGFKVSGFQLEQKPYATSFIDGTRANEVVTVPTEGVLSAEEGTIEFWYKPNELHNYNDILGGSFNQGRWLLHTNDNGNLVWDWNNTGKQDNLIAYSVLQAGLFHLITVTWGPDGRKIYVNKVLKASKATYDPSMGFPSPFGSGVVGNDANGLIDDLRISRRARTDEEISAYDLTKPLPVDEHTTAVYRFDGSLTAASPNVIDNQGTEPTYPTFRATVLEPITFLNIVSPDDYMRIGRDVEVEEEPFEQYELILKDSCSTLVGWSHLPGGMFLETNMVGGEMGVRGGWAFEAKSFGSNPNGWVGPAIKKSLPEPVQDFRIAVDLSLYNQWGQVGKIILYLMDEESNIIGYLAMADGARHYEMNTGIIRIGPPVDQGGNQVINYTGDVPGVWNRFRGILRLERFGENITAYIGKVREDGTHHGRHTRHYRDEEGVYQTPVAQICVYIGTAKNYEPCVMHMNDISVWKINNPADYQVPYIAEAGDELVFDHSQNLILRNGEPILWSKDFGARFFPIHPGQTEIAVQPEGSTLMTADWRDVYK